MSDYELLAALNMGLQLLWTIFATYVSIVFAFLVASYLVAGKLTTKIVSIVIPLYALVALWAVFGLSRTAGSVIGVIAEIKRVVLESDSSLGWHSAAQMPDFMMGVVAFFSPLIAVLAFIGSILFFFHQRKIELSAKSG